MVGLAAQMTIKQAVSQIGIILLVVPTRFVRTKIFRCLGLGLGLGLPHKIKVKGHKRVLRRSGILGLDKIERLGQGQIRGGGRDVHR
jgi:hypothetical protein